MFHTTNAPDTPVKPLRLDDICAARVEIACGYGWATDMLDDFLAGGIKFSQMLLLGSHREFRYVPIIYSIYLKHEDIFLHWVTNLSIREFRVGKMVYDYLQSDDHPSTSGWVRYRAKRLGLDRPYVSMG